MLRKKGRAGPVVCYQVGVTTGLHKEDVVSAAKTGEEAEEAGVAPLTGAEAAGEAAVIFKW
jgi:hypothetical protein